MATKTNKNDAAKTTHLDTITIAGAWLVTETVSVKIGDKTVTYTAGAAPTPTTVATGLQAAIAALSAADFPEFSELTSANPSAGVITMTGNVPGVPSTITVSTTSASGTITNVHTTAATGPWHWDNANNWSPSGVPAGADDVVLTDTTVPFLFGLGQSGVTLNSLTADETYAPPQLGLPKWNTLGYAEYRADYLAISATTIDWRSPCPLVKIDTGSVQTTINLNSSGQPSATGQRAMLWKGTHANNVLNCVQGSFAAAFYDGEVATLLTVRQAWETNQGGDTDVRLGKGCTLTTLTQTGGKLELFASFTTLNAWGGETQIMAGTPGTMNILGGTVRYRTSGNYTLAVVNNGGELDFSEDLRGKTGTNTTLTEPATYRDPGKAVTWTNPAAITGNVTLDLGPSYNLQRS